MSRWGSDQLPISWPPLPGEALDSWLQTYASRLHTSTRTLLNYLGLRTSRLHRMVTTLTNEETTALTRGTGLSPDVLQAMTLARFDQIAVAIDPESRLLLHPPAWRRQTGSRFCPACLADTSGRWTLRWRLPWSFACLHHRVLLRDYCPAGAHRTAPDRPFQLTQQVTAGRCSHPADQPDGVRRRAAQRGICGYRLAQAPVTKLPKRGRILATQQHVDALIDATINGASGHTRPGGTLTELHLVAFRSLRVLAGAQPPAHVQKILSEVPDVTVGAGPLDSYDAGTIGASTAIAITVLTDTSDALLSWLVTNQHQQMHPPREPGRIVDTYNNAGPALLGRVISALDQQMRTPQRIAYRSFSTTPRLPINSQQQITRRAASIPALMWPAWTLALAPDAKTGASTLTPLRADLAILLLICGTSFNGAAAAVRLGHAQPPPALNRCLPSDPDERRTALTVLDDLAYDLDHHPAAINYTRRRTHFATTAINAGAYARLARTHGWPEPSPLQLHLLTLHLRNLLTGGMPAADRDRRGHDRWNPLLIALPLIVREFVTAQANQQLRHHHVREPLTWQPPLPTATHWPGLDPASVDHQLFVSAIAEHAYDRLAVRHIEQATGLNATQIRLLTHITDLDMPDDQWTSLASWNHLPSDVNDFAAELHQHQPLTKVEIARLGLTSDRTIRAALTQAGQPALQPYPSKKQIPKQWFIDNFIGTGKTCAESAAELGVCRNTFSRYAQHHGIDTRHTTQQQIRSPFADWPARRQPSAAVNAASRIKRGVEYLRQLITLPDHPSQRAAAQALGISEQQLNSRRRTIENAAGFPLCQPAVPGQPIVLTTRGRKFLREATTAIKRLDREPRS